MILALAGRSTLNDFKSRTSSKEGYDLSVVGLEGRDFVCAPTKERNGQFGSTFPAIGHVYPILKRPELVNRRGSVFHHDIVRPHKSLVTHQKLLEVGCSAPPSILD